MRTSDRHRRNVRMPFNFTFDQGGGLQQPYLGVGGGEEGGADAPVAIPPPFFPTGLLPEKIFYCGSS